MDKDWLISLQFNDVVAIDDRYYLGYELFTNRVYKLDFHNDSAECIFVNEKEERNSIHQCLKMILVGDELWMFPFWSKKICRLNIKTLDKTYFEITDDYIDSNGKSMGACIVEAVYFNNKFYCFGMHIPGILEIDVLGKMVLSDSVHSVIGKNTKDGNYIKWPVYISIPDENGEVKIIFKESNFVISYKLETRDYSKWINGTSKWGSPINATFDGKYYYVAEGNSIIRINIESCEEKKYIDFPQKLMIAENNDTSFGLIDANGIIFVYPFYSNIMMIFDKEEERIIEYNQIKIPDNISQLKFDKGSRFGDILLLFSRCDKAIYELTLNGKKVKKHFFFELADNYLEIEKFDRGKLVLEESQLGKFALNGFIKHLSSV